jgi:hypothetical protein
MKVAHAAKADGQTGIRSKLSRRADIRVRFETAPVVGNKSSSATACEVVQGV